MSITVQGSSGINAYQDYLKEKKEKEKSGEKLSSGYQINSASDDPARLAISERMRAEITINQAAQDNAKMTQLAVKTAESALQSINDMQHRAEALAVTSSNGIYSNSDRAMMNQEMGELVSEINRVSASTDFNGIELLDGSLSASTSDGLVAHVDTSGLTDHNISVNIEGSSTSVNIDASRMDITTLEQATEILATLEEFVTKITDQRADLGATYNALGHTISNLAVMEENLQSSESKIRDTNMAKEATKDNENALKLNFATNVLAQADKDKDAVLNILGS